jgi:hypothetical protein
MHPERRDTRVLTMTNATEHRGDHPHVFTNGTCVCGYTLTDRAYRDTHRDELATAIAGIDASRFPIMRTEREVTFVTETGFTIEGWIGTRTLQRVCSAVLTWAALVIALELRHTATLRAIDGADSLAGFADGPDYLCMHCSGTARPGRLLCALCAQETAEPV